MARFSTEAKVGMVVLLGIALLTYMTFKVGGYRFGPEQGYQIYAVFDSVAGIDLKTPVKIAGVSVGEVERIELTDSKARLTLRIRPEVKIRKGAQTLIRSSGLLGEKYIEIVNAEGEQSGTLSDVPPTINSPSAPGPSSWIMPEDLLERWAGLLGDLVLGPAHAAEAEGQEPLSKEPFVKEGEVIQQKGGSADMDQLINRLNAISDDLKAVSHTLKEALGTKEGEKSLKEIIQNIQELTENLNTVVKENRGDINKTVVNLEEFTRSLKESGPQILERLDRITEEVERGEGTIGKLIHDEGVYNKLNDTLADIKEVTGKIRKGEGTIGKLIYDEEAYNNLNTTLKGMSSTFDRITQFKLFVSFRNEYQLDSSDNKGYFALRLQPQDYKYYLVEVVDNPRGVVTKNVTDVTTTPPSPPSTTETTTFTTERKLQFSAELARRFWDIWIRGGLMENTFGVGVDYEPLTDRLKFSLDSWDFNSDDPQMDNAELKFTANLSFLRYFSVTVGYDNILNKEIDTFIIGGVFRFEDDDLKYLLGSVARF